MVTSLLPARDPADARLTPVMLRGELVATGASDRSLAVAVRRGELVKVRRGAYVAGEDWRRLDVSGQHEVTARAAVLQLGSDVVVSHASGLQAVGGPTWGLDLREVHVTRTDGRAGRREAGVCQHRGLLIDGDRMEVYGLPVMHPTRLGLELTMTHSVEVALVAVNDLLHRQLTTPERLAERYARGMEQWGGSLTTDVVLRLADGRIESVGESRTLFMLWKHGRGIPLPQPNYEVRDAAGRVVARLDFAWPELGVFLEFDGRAKYLELLRDGESVADCVLREKRRQELVERRTGWRCIRIVWAELDRPQRTVAMIREALYPSVVA